jgi:RNA-directed DNA polymerase
MPGKAISRPSKILSKKKLYDAWELARTLGKRSSFPGVDGIVGKDFAKNLDQNLAKISRLFADGHYEFQPLAMCWLPKRDNPTKERLICVPTVADRLVQRTIGEYLERSGNLKISNPVSFGFQKKKSVKTAVEQALKYRNDEMCWVVKTDICAFFDKVPREQLSLSLRGKVPESLYPLLQQVIACEAKPKTKLDVRKLQEKGIVQGVGLRQGMPLSPMLSNFALRKFDEKAIHAEFKMVRYADDIACFCKTQEEAKNTHKTIKQWLDNMGYDIPDLAEETKTKIIKPNEPVEFLGYDIGFDQAAQSYNITISEMVHNRVHKSIKKVASFATCKEERWKFADVVRHLNSKAEAYKNSYQLASNLDELERRMENWHRDALRSLLKELFGEEVLARLTPEKLLFLGLNNS